MQRNPQLNINMLPSELITACLAATGDVRAMMQFGLVSWRMHEISQSEALRQPFFKAVEPVADALIKAVGAEEDVEAGKLSRLSIMAYLAIKNLAAVKLLLQPYQSIKLIHVSYEGTARQNALFFKQATRELYLSPGFVAEYIYNLSSVKRLVTYSLPIEQVDFAPICNSESYKGLVIFSGPIPDSAVCLQAAFNDCLTQQTSGSRIPPR